MTRTGLRSGQAGTVDELTASLGVVRGCELVGRSRATHHRQGHPKPRMHGPWPKTRHRAELDTAERGRVLAMLNSQEYADLAVAQIWARELDAGRYWCSQATMYRILADAGQDEVYY